MKLLSCHIFGFGKFIDKKFEFPTAAVIKGENGWGKTTLCAFIEAMLYGLDNTRAKGLDENERLKYTPFHGHIFGGALAFEYKGKKYRVERKFGKTAGADECKIFDENNLLSKDFSSRSQSLGEQIFGVDKESFERTAYIRQGETRTLATLSPNLNQKLSSLFSLSVASDENAIAVLTEAERKLRAKRKPAQGKLDEIDSRLFSLSLQEKDCEKTLESARAWEEELLQTDRAGMRSNKEKRKKPSFLNILGLFFLALGGILVFWEVWACALSMFLSVLCFSVNGKRKEKIVKKSKGEPSEKTEREVAERRGWLIAQLENAEKTVEQAEEIKREIAFLQSEKERLEKRYLAIVTAREFLEKAQRNTAVKYLNPVEKKCKEYAQVLALDKLPTLLNASGDLLVQSQGAWKEKEYFSAGERDLLAFCVRLAVAETVFTGEKPPLILDDPLVELDDSNTERAKKLIRSLTKEYQIIYCTCKEERTL